MTTRLPSVLFAGAVAALCATQPARADIYTWVDGAGMVTLSNLAPPKGVRVTNVVHASVASDAAREAQMQALAARVRELEEDAQRAKQAIPPRVEYVAAPPPPSAAYGLAAPAPVQYIVEAQPPVSSGCDYGWMNCGTGWNAGYPLPVVILGAGNLRRFHGAHAGHHSPFHPPPRTFAPRPR